MLALSFERIHHSNLIGIGILPLRILVAMSPTHLKLNPGDMIEIDAPVDALAPHGIVRIRIHRASGERASHEGRSGHRDFVGSRLLLIAASKQFL